MGHGYSRSTPPGSAATASSSSSTAPKSASSPPSSAASGGSFNLKRAIAGRRKKSEDATAVFSRPSGKTREGDEQRRIDQTQTMASSPPAQLQPYQRQQKQAPAPLTLSPANPTQVMSLSLAHHKGAKQLTQLASQVFSSKKTSKGSPTTVTSPTPPTPPPKSARYARQPQAQQQPSPPLPETATVSVGPDRTSIIPISPAISSAVNYLRMREDEKDAMAKKEDGAEREGGSSGEKEKADRNDMKESWRKSDSTISHHTIRPGATTATKGSRPVSMAESLQSTHTIVPVSKRQSALIADADFGMPEEEDDIRSMNELVRLVTPAATLSTVPIPKKPSLASLKTKNRRSMSLSLTHLAKSQSQGPAYHHSASVTDLKHPSVSYSEGVPPTPPASDHGHGFYPSSSVNSHSTAGSSNIRGRFVAWAGPSTSSLSSSSSNRQERSLPAAPQPPSLRQTAISMTTGFPTGFAKRAVEKMGRAWGISSSSSQSGNSSSASSMGPSSYSSSHMDCGLVRTSSNTSTPSVGHINASFKGKHRRTPGGASGTHSVTSSITSGSESEYMPVLGRQVRGRMRSVNGGPVAGGVVFGRELWAAVRDTAIGVGVVDGDGHSGPELEREDLRKLEDRKVPALVVRCAQHMLLWGVLEEGLFRVSGRASHTNKIRAEFDTGADYDMLQCSPGDLDPHAVASVFKAYLRELPEPILTTKLSPYFDAAISKEAASNPPEPSNTTSTNSKGQGLPSNPRSGGSLPAIRKAPSLSTLAMPSFAGMKPPSKSLINALRSLVAQLPDENRDLLRTLVELINATADRKDTKMPLSNLLLVLCPSLNMNAPLLRSLCAREVWVDENRVIDIKRETVFIDISAPDTAAAVEDEDGEEEYSDANDSNEADCVDQASVDEAASDYDASVESSLVMGDADRRQRPVAIDRSEIPTVYLDTKSRFSNNSVASSTHELGHTRDLSSTSSSLQDTSSLSSNEFPSHQYSVSPPPLSRSTDSVATPPTTSSQVSLSDPPLHNVKREGVVSKSFQDLSNILPQIADSTPLSLNMGPRKPTISSPIPASVVQFPSSPTAENLHTPASPNKRRSIPLLSLPNFSPLSGAQPPSPADSIASQRGLRGKKPSLRLLFSKRSTSSLNGLNSVANSKPHISAPIQLDSGSQNQSPHSASDSSVSTPRSVVTAPLAASVSSLPPVLDTPIEGSSFAMELGISISPPSTASTTDQRDDADSDLVDPLKPGQTPIADRYLLSLAASSQVSLASPTSQLRPTPIVRGRGASVSSTTSSNHLGVFDDDDSGEDWTQSVLLAADVNGEWKIQRPA